MPGQPSAAASQDRLGRARWLRAACRELPGARETGARLRAPAGRRLGRRRRGGDHREAEHPHERLGGVGGRAPAVALPAVLVHRASRPAALLDPPVQDHVPAPRGFLAGLEILGEIRHGAADDHEVAGRRTQPGFDRRLLDGARAPPDGARSTATPGSRGTRTACALHPQFEDAKGGSERQALSAASPPRGRAPRAHETPGVQPAAAPRCRLPIRRAARSGRASAASTLVPRCTVHRAPCTVHSAGKLRARRITPPGSPRRGIGPTCNLDCASAAPAGPCLTPRSGGPRADLMPWHSCCSARSWPPSFGGGTVPGGGAPCRSESKESSRASASPFREGASGRPCSIAARSGVSASSASCLDSTESRASPAARSPPAFSPPGGRRSASRAMSP